MSQIEALHPPDPSIDTSNPDEVSSPKSGGSNSSTSSSTSTPPSNFEESINVTCIFVNPANSDDRLIHLEVVNGVPSKELFKKPYGWYSKTLIHFASDGLVKKTDVTKWKCLLVSGTERSTVEGQIKDGNLELVGKRVGEGDDGKLNSFAKKTDLSNECKLEFANGIALTYKTKFIIVDPEKCGK
jgi:hypothetical protein